MKKGALQPLNDAASLRYAPGTASSLGCQSCGDYAECGGLKISKPGFSCVELCPCSDPRRCQFVCPRNPRNFVGRIQEVQGFTLLNVPRTNAIKIDDLPDVVPCLFHGSSREATLNAEAVAIPLSYLFNTNGNLKYASKNAIAARFKFSPTAKLVIIGVSRDGPLERYWSVGRRANLAKALATLQPSLVTSPNFTFFSNVPRYDNLYNRKRIARCFVELLQEGIPASLHLNGRTPEDFQAMGAFLRNREEVTSVTAEFATGARSRTWARFFVQQVKYIGEVSQRRLRLVLRGGVPYIRELLPHFSKITLIDSSAFMKTMKRQELEQCRSGHWNWMPVLTLVGQPIDELLARNVGSSAEQVQQIIEAYRPHTA